MRDLEELFEGLSKSKFRNGFKLKPADIEYINKRGMAIIEQHARDFITVRLAPAEPKNDGKQTPMRRHPVFIAQHATATCCRSGLAKWHKITLHKPLSQSEIEYVVSIIIIWIKNQIDLCQPMV
ncbi:MAG: DUF4186 domain-containing protein [Sedimentisphaerales bacterium]